MSKPGGERKDVPQDGLGSVNSPPQQVEQKSSPEAKPQPPDPKPSLQTIGLTQCSVCQAEVGVVLTRSGHPFTACGRCGARTFYNSRIAIEILKRHMRRFDHV